MNKRAVCLLGSLNFFQVLLKTTGTYQKRRMITSGSVPVPDTHVLGLVKARRKHLGNKIHLAKLIIIPLFFLFFPPYPFSQWGHFNGSLLYGQSPAAKKCRDPTVEACLFLDGTDWPPSSWI
jgi:hypothetical protein